MTGVVIFALILLFVGSAIYSSRADSKRLELIGDALRGVPNFTVNNSLISLQKGIAFDQKNEKIAIALKLANEVKVCVIDCKKITGVDIEFVEGRSTIKKPLFSDMSTERSFESITLCITLADSEIPLFRFELYRLSGKPDKLSKITEQEWIERANVWKSQLLSIVRKNQLPIEGGAVMSITAEVEKLYELFQKGILSEDEFRIAKNKII